MGHNTREFQLHESVTGLPRKIQIVSHHNSEIVIAIDKARWLVLTTNELSIFKLLYRGLSLNAVLEHFKEIDLIAVLKKIEIMNFYESATNTISNYLETATIILTDGCNLRCKHCLMSAGPSPKQEKEMTEEKWFSLLQKLKKTGIEKIVFYGGEPLLKKKALDIIVQAYSLNFEIKLMTNGTLIDITNQAHYSMFCHEIQISLDGLEKSHDHIRGKGTFKKTWRAIELLSPIGDRLTISVTTIPENLDQFTTELPVLLKQIHDLNPDIKILISPELLTGRDVEAQGKGSHFNKVIEQAAAEATENKCNNKPILMFPGEVRNQCGWGEGWWINSLGKLLPCHLAEHPIDIDRESMTQAHDESSIEKVATCNTCSLKSFCGGRCRIENKKLTGNMLQGDCSQEDKENIILNLIDSFESIMSQQQEEKK